jgi:hypothetical protein
MRWSVAVGEAVAVRLMCSGAARAKRMKGADRSFPFVLDYALPAKYTDQIGRVVGPAGFPKSPSEIKTEVAKLERLIEDVLAFKFSIVDA